MSPEIITWKALYGQLQITLREYGFGRFQVVISDGQLTHMHPVNCTDVDAAQWLAREHALRFAALGPADECADIPCDLRWERVAGVSENATQLPEPANH